MLVQCQAKYIDDIANAVLVTIAIRGGKIHIYPQRSSEVVIYKVWDRPNARVGVPEQIRWAVDWGQDVLPGDVVVIRSKSGFQDVFSENKFEIDYPNNTVSSGPPQTRVAPAHSILWCYSIELLRGTTRLDFLDPGGEIKDEP